LFAHFNALQPGLPNHGRQLVDVKARVVMRRVSALPASPNRREEAARHTAEKLAHIFRRHRELIGCDALGAQHIARRLAHQLRYALVVDLAGEMTRTRAWRSHQSRAVLSTTSVIRRTICSRVRHQTCGLSRHLAVSAITLKAIPA